MSKNKFKKLEFNKHLNIISDWLKLWHNSKIENLR